MNTLKKKDQKYAIITKGRTLQLNELVFEFLLYILDKSIKECRLNLYSDKIQTTINAAEFVQFSERSKSNIYTKDDSSGDTVFVYALKQLLSIEAYVELILPFQDQPIIQSYTSSVVPVVKTKIQQFHLNMNPRTLLNIESYLTFLNKKALINVRGNKSNSIYTFALFIYSRLIYGRFNPDLLEIDFATLCEFSNIRVAENKPFQGRSKTVIKTEKYLKTIQSEELVFFEFTLTKHGVILKPSFSGILY